MKERTPPEGSQPFNVDKAIAWIKDQTQKVPEPENTFFKKRIEVWEKFENGLEEKIAAGELTREDANRLRAQDRALREINQSKDQRFNIYTKYAIEEKLKSDIVHANYVAEPLTLAAMDIDHFGDINNRHGHRVGDKILEATIKHYDDQPDATLGRWGGDEFLLYFRGQTVDEVYPKVVETNRDYPQVTEPFKEQYGFESSITMSIGVTEYIPGESFEEFVERADTILYRAKKNGRNRVERD